MNRKPPAVDLGVQTNPKARTRRLANGKSILTAPVVGGTIRAVGGGWVTETLTVCPSCGVSVRTELGIGADQIPTSTIRGKRMSFVRDPETLEIVENVDLRRRPPTTPTIPGMTPVVDGTAIGLQHASSDRRTSPTSSKNETTSTASAWPLTSTNATLEGDRGVKTFGLCNRKRSRKTV